MSYNFLTIPAPVICLILVQTSVPTSCGHNTVSTARVYAACKIIDIQSGIMTNRTYIVLLIYKLRLSALVF